MKVRKTFYCKMERQRMVSGSELASQITMKRKLLTSVSWSVENFRDAVRLLKQDEATMNFGSREFTVAGMKGWLELRISKLQLTHLQFELNFKTHKRFWRFSPPILNGPTVVELKLPTRKRNASFELYQKTSWSPGSRWVFEISSTSIPSCPCESHADCRCQPFVISFEIFGIAEQPATDTTETHRSQIVPRPIVPKERERLLEELEQELDQAIRLPMGTLPVNVKIHCCGTEYEVNISSFKCSVTWQEMMQKYWPPHDGQPTADFERRVLEGELGKHEKDEVDKFMSFILMGLLLNLRKNSEKEALLAWAYAVGADVLTKYLLLITTVNDNNVLQILAAAFKYPDYKCVQEECFKVLNLKGIEYWLQSSQWLDLKEKYPKGAADVLEALISLGTPASPPLASEEAPAEIQSTLYTFLTENASIIKWLYCGIIVSLAVCLLAWWTWSWIKAELELEVEEDRWCKNQLNECKEQSGGGGRNRHHHRY